jgi:hypothetical protein
MPFVANLRVSQKIENESGRGGLARLHEGPASDIVSAYYFCSNRRRRNVH